MKTNLFTKAALFLLAAATALVCFAGCSSGGSVGDGTRAESAGTEAAEATTAGRISDGMPEKDMSRSLQEFVILNYTDAAHGYSLKTMVVEDEKEAGLIEKAIYDRNMQIEDRYQVLITERQNDRPYDLVRNDLAVGTAEYDVAMMYEEHINRCLVAGALRLFEEVPYIDVEQPWWNDSANDIYSFGGHQYAGVGDWCLSMYSKLHTYLLNKTVLASHPDAPDLYELVRKKEWTVDRMFSIASEFTVDLDGDENDIYGVTGTSKVHFQLLLTGCGMKYIEKTDSGYTFALTSVTANTVIGKLIDLSERYYYNNNPTTHNGGVVTTEFTSNRALLLAGMITTLESVLNNVSNVGLLPAPLYDESQDDYHTIAVGGLLTCFPAATAANRLEDVGILVEALSCLSYQDVVPVYQEKLLKLRRADAPDDAEMMDIMFHTMSFDLGCSTWANDVRLPIMANVFHPLNKAYTSYLRTFQSDLDEQLSETASAVLTRYSVSRSSGNSAGTNTEDEE